MNIKKDTLTSSEWIVMEALWSSKESMVLSEIIDAIGNKVEWNYQTYASYLKILCEKDFISFRKRGRNKFYYPLIEKEACIKAEGENILNKMNLDTAESLLLYMLKSTIISNRGQQELIELIEELSQKESEL